MQEETVSLLFSGGADSTFSAALLAERFGHVHLVTFKHYATWRVRSSDKSEARLRAAFPRTVFTHTYLNSSRLFFKLQKRVFRDLQAHPFLNHYFCGACKLAMHSCLVAHNMRSSIKHAASGASRLMPMFPDQTPGGSQAIKELYAAYGMSYENPVFDMEGVDRKAAELGLLSEKHLKARHKADFTRISDLLVPVRNALSNTQGFCFFIAAVDPYISMAEKEYTKKEISEMSLAYFHKTINEECRPWIDAEISGKR